MKTYRVHKNTRQQMQYKVYDPMFWIEGVNCTYAQVSDDGNMCIVKYTYYNETDNANISITIIDKKNEIIEYREYEADNIMVKTIYDCKEKIENDFHFPVVSRNYEK